MNRKNIEDINFLNITSEEAAELGLNVIFEEKTALTTGSTA